MTASRVLRVLHTMAWLFIATTLPLQAQTSAGGSPTAGTPQFNVTPTQLVIPKGQTSTSLMLRNDGAEPVRFQVSASAWSNDADGQIVLHQTSDVVFFPVLFGVEPGQSRRVRVAVTERATERELSYRLLVEQLPTRAAQPQLASVQMLMRASIPLFVQPHTLSARTTLGQARVVDGRLSFVVRNVGTVHVSIVQVNVRARWREARPPFDAQLLGWYLLSGESRTYRVTLPLDLCREQPTLAIAVKFADNAQPLTLAQPIGEGDCPR